MAYEEIFSALADPTRRHIFETLRGQAKSVAEVAASQPVSRPAVSQHLKVLEQADLVVAERRGNRRIYSIKRESLNELRAYLDSFWSDVLTAYGDEIILRMKKN